MDKKRKDPAAVKLGRRGGKIGGKAQVAKGFAMMDPDRLAEIGRKSAEKRRAK
jgi:general stress protein YciG